MPARQKVKNPLGRITESESLLHSYLLCLVFNQYFTVIQRNGSNVYTILRVRCPVRKVIPSQSAQMLDIANQYFKIAFINIYKLKRPL